MRRILTACVFVVALLLPSEAHAQVTKVIKFLTGAAVGLGAHESGHLITGAIFNAHPGVMPIHYAGIPFFAITHDRVSPRKELVISSAGFWMQHAGNELLLSERPNLRHESSPFLKGYFAFNLATSAVYATAAIGQFGALERDTLGMARAFGKNGWKEPVVGALIIAPSAIDVYRYYHPDQRWAVWVSRGMKVAFMALTLLASRPIS